VVVRYCIRCIYVMEFGIIGGVASVRLHYIVHTHLVAKDYPSLSPLILKQVKVDCIRAR
jgi:hypothetical protein